MLFTFYFHNHIVAQCIGRIILHRTPSMKFWNWVELPSSELEFNRLGDLYRSRNWSGIVFIGIGIELPKRNWHQLCILVIGRARHACVKCKVTLQLASVSNVRLIAQWWFIPRSAGGRSLRISRQTWFADSLPAFWMSSVSVKVYVVGTSGTELEDGS